uniref:GCS light chain n=1 Tax=Clastoptera arizonana TaxID=38151 RepID=A0A1B6E8S0_9HEMI
MLPKLPGSVSQLCIYTGNILSLNEIKKKAGQDATEELLSSLKIIVNNWKIPENMSDSCISIKNSDESLNNVTDVAPTELKTSVKVFIAKGKKEELQNAIDNLFSSLGAVSVDSLVLAYMNHSSMSNDELLKDILELWKILERNVENKKLDRIGISDVDTDLFIDLYKSAKIKPSIVQINLQSCCVVPPALQEFTKANEVQLLTHNDPLDILPGQALSEIFDSNNKRKEVRLNWVSRYQVHVICRGVLAIKGYIVSIDLN